MRRVLAGQVPRHPAEQQGVGDPVDRRVEEGATLARRLGVQGTPAFAAGRTGKDLSLLPVRSLDADGLRPFLDQLLGE